MKKRFQDPILHSALFVFGATLLAVACLPEEDKDNRDNGDSGGSLYYSYSYGTTSTSRGNITTADFGPEDIVVSLTHEGLTIQMVEDARELAFGMTQTGDCAGACWSSESCGASPDSASICHDVPPNGLTLVPVSAADQVLPSVTSLVRPELQGSLTFIVDDGAECYTWGHNPAHYVDQFGCTAW